MVAVETVNVAVISGTSGLMTTRADIVQKNAATVTLSTVCRCAQVAMSPTVIL
jgi:hypothetical protein